MARQLVEFEAHAAAIAEERDLANLGREQVFFVHQRIDADRFRAAEQPAEAPLTLPSARRTSIPPTRA